MSPQQAGRGPGQTYVVFLESLAIYRTFRHVARKARCVAYTIRLHFPSVWMKPPQGMGTPGFRQPTATETGFFDCHKSREGSQE